jgi:RNA polymerase sigma-70 factor (ECF subfamily)
MREPFTDEQFRRVYHETLDAMYAYTSRRCGGQRELAEDVTQEVWLRALDDWGRNGIPEKPFGWLTTAARNLILNNARRRVSVSIDLVSPSDVLAAVENNAASDSTEIASLMNEMLARLPQADAQLLESFHFDQLRMSQLATLYGTTERAIEGRLRRARARLRRELEITLKAERGLA